MKNKSYKDWFIIEYNAGKNCWALKLTDGVILSIMHKANNENLYTLKTFYIFLRTKIRYKPV
jgi:hypothetical protein